VLCPARDAHADFIDHFADPHDVGEMKIPRVGTTHILVLPLVIDDLPFENPQHNEADFLADLHAFYDVDVPGFGFTHYYDTVSLGRFHPVVTIASPVHFPTCPDLGGFANCNIPRDAGLSSDLTGAAQTIHDSLTFMDEILRCAQQGPGAGRACTSGGGVDLKAFDTSGATAGVPDGFVDGVILVTNGGFSSITLPVKDLSGNQILNFLGRLPSFTYGTETVGAVSIAGVEGQGGAKATFVSAHEFGHLLGFADLYNEDGTTDDLPYTIMGGWYYDQPASLLDAFSRVAIGWAHLVQVDKSQTITLTPAETTGMVLKLGTGDEFFLVELRRKDAGVDDTDLTIDSGVVVERVQLNKRPDPAKGKYLATLQHCVNCDAFDPMLMIEEKSGAYDLQFGRGRDDVKALFQAGDTMGPSTDTAPRSLSHPVFSTNLLSGAATGIALRVVSSSRDGAVVEATVPDVADPCAAIADLCGDLACHDGSCGAPPPTPVTPTPTPTGTHAGVCACLNVHEGQVPGAACVLLAVGVAMGVRRRRR
jgi:M6 family metalloprotease-like protein